MRNGARSGPGSGRRSGRGGHGEYGGRVGKRQPVFGQHQAAIHEASRDLGEAAPDAAPAPCSHEETPVGDAHAVEPWSVVEPQLSRWLAAADGTPSAEGVEVLLRYAEALVDEHRLEELGFLAKLVTRTCCDRPAWRGDLRKFVDVVDVKVRACYEGASFAPLGYLKRKLDASVIDTGIDDSQGLRLCRILDLDTD